MSDTQPQENKMGIMPVGKLIFTMSLPMMISMLVQALYNIVDSMFVARLSEKALTAVSIAFPIQNLMIAVATGTGVGINALLSMRLGEKKQEDVNKTAGNALVLSLFNYLLFLILGLTISRPYFQSQSNDPEIIQYGIDYMTLCTTLSFCMFFGITLDRLLQATGRTLYTMFSQLTGAILNTILDPLFIFGLWGFPQMGIKGAAIATVLGQAGGLVVTAIFNWTKNKDIQFGARYLKLDGKIVARIYKVGVPSIIMGSIGSVMVYFLNLILSAFTATAVAVLGVYFKLQSFIFMPVFGLNNGVVPIVAYNYGARKKDRIIRTIQLGILSAVCIMLFGTLVFQLFPTQLLGIFKASPEMLAIGVPALRIISIHFPVAAICIIFGSVFQALGRGMLSMFTSFIRQIIVLLPAAWLLSLTGNVNAIWWAFPIAEVASLLFTTISMIYVSKTQISKIQAA